MTRALAKPEKESYLLVEFRHGEDAGSSERYTDFQQDTIGFTSTPLMEVDIPDNTGTFDETETKIILPIDAFTDRLSDGLPHSPTYVKIEERTQGFVSGDEASVLILFRGQVKRVIRNYQGRTNMVAIFAVPAKSRLNVPLGLQCNHHCERRLFSPGCGLLQVSFDQPGEIASIDGKEVTIVANAAIESPTAPGGTNDRFWERGYLEKDGLRIGIHIWTIADPKVFVLRKRPPADWILAGTGSVLFVPGCHGTIEDCRDVWDNEEHFLGLGYAMPDYSPNIENPTGCG